MLTTMKLHYLSPFLSLSAALVAPAAELQVPADAETAADLLPVLRGVNELPKEQARELLQRLPIPRQSSCLLRERMLIYKNFPRLIQMVSQLGSGSETARSELLREDPRLWAICMSVEMGLAQKNKNEELLQKLVAEGEAGLQQLQPEQGLGLIKAMGFSFLALPQDEQQKLIEDADWQRRVATQLEETAGEPDELTALAMTFLYDECAMGVDVPRAMQYALRAAVAEMYLQNEIGLRNNLRLSLARAAALQGETALPLQLAALRQLEKEDKNLGGLGAYRLGCLYEKVPENLSMASEQLAQAAILAGAELGHPACLQKLAAYTENPAEREKMLLMAAEAKFDPEKDYLNTPQGRKLILKIATRNHTLPDRSEREVQYWLRLLMARVEMADWMAGLENESEIMKVVGPVFLKFCDVTFSQAENLNGLAYTDEWEQADSQDLSGTKSASFMRALQEKFTDDEELAQACAQSAWVIESMGRDARTGEPLTAEQLEVLQKFADAGNADALYLLAWRQVKFLGEFTEESWAQMVQALQAGSADAAWFLFTAFWEGLYNVEQNSMSATNCYRLALQRCQADAWARVRERAEDDMARLYALVHMRHSSGGEVYSLLLDDELQAYGRAHPELQGIIAPLRLLYIGSALREDSFTADEKHELRLRALQLAVIPQPAVLPTADVDFWHRLAEYEYRDDLNSERASAARVALPALRENRADLLLVSAEKKITHEQAGQTTADLPAEALRGAHLVCRECDRALADFAIQAGVRSVTAMRMPSAERDYLRSHNIAAGGWEIVP